MNLPANAFQRISVVLLERRVALLLQLAHPGFDGRLVDAGHVVVFVRVDAKRLAQRGQEMFLVQLRVALHRLLVLDAFRNVTQLLDRFPFQFVEGVRHTVLRCTRNTKDTKDTKDTRENARIKEEITRALSGWTARRPDALRPGSGHPERSRGDAALKACGDLLGCPEQRRRARLFSLGGRLPGLRICRKPQRDRASGLPHHGSISTPQHRCDLLKQPDKPARYLKMLFGILTCTPYTGRSTSWVMATFPA